MKLFLGNVYHSVFIFCCQEVYPRTLVCMHLHIAISSLTICIVIRTMEKGSCVVVLWISLRLKQMYFHFFSCSYALFSLTIIFMKQLKPRFHNNLKKVQIMEALFHEQNVKSLGLQLNMERMLVSKAANEYVFMVTTAVDFLLSLIPCTRLIFPEFHNFSGSYAQLLYWVSMTCSSIFDPFVLWLDINTNNGTRCGASSIFKLGTGHK